MILSYVVARDGIEPPHPGLHSGTLPTELTSGATGRARTADHPFTRRTLYLLSYRGEPMAGLEPAPTDWKSVVQPTHPIGRCRDSALSRFYPCKARDRPSCPRKDSNL